jgi:hypothetical protein
MWTGVEFTEHLLTSGSDLEILITRGGSRMTQEAEQS